ncbi:MAG: PD-(D/E)XK nuclease family protein, partial [Patescibacteria group bacterium]
SENFHIEEERRLFYVALTRAKESLHLTCAKDYGGAREKRPSVFIKEAGLNLVESEKINFEELGFFKDLKALDEQNQGQFLLKKEELKLPNYFSFSQFASFSRCPLQYKYAHILKVPVPTEKDNLTFGKLVHNCLYQFLLEILQGENKMQDNLFEKPSNLSKEKLLKIYKDSWNDEGYESIDSRDVYKNKGKNIMNLFWENIESRELPNIYFLEKDLRLKFKGYTIIGRIDRIDKMPDGSFEIIDYKTGSTKKVLSADEKKQLILYKIIIESVLNIKVSKMTYYYLEEGHKLSFEAKEKEVEATMKWLDDTISEIVKKEFLPNPSSFGCGFCDFKDICEFRQ